MFSPTFKNHSIKKAFQDPFSKVKSLVHLVEKLDVRKNRPKSRSKRLSCRGRKAEPASRQVSEDADLCLMRFSEVLKQVRAGEMDA